MFAAISDQLKGRPELVAKTRAIFVWNVTKNGKKATQWSQCLTIDSLFEMLLQSSGPEKSTR